MNLYATVTSERASKGQGGNEFIRIDLLGGSKVNPVDMGRLEMRMKNDDKYCQLVHYAPDDKVQIVYINSPRYNTKGEKQKGEPLAHCDNHATYDWDCEDCERKSNGL
jgi:type IV secretory pathway VirB9-like protein